MIRFPNSFIGENLTIEAFSDIPIDFSGYYQNIRNLPQEIYNSICDTEQFFITFSNMESSINESEIIKYSEVIIKIEIIYHGKKYLFPVISFVSNEMSLIRGFGMGFKKEMCGTLHLGSQTAFLQYQDEVLLKVDYNAKNKSIQTTNPNLSNPFLLVRDFDIGTEVRDIVTLNVKTHEKSKQKVIHDDIIEVGVIKNANIYSKTISLSKDSFDILGLVRVIS